MREKAHAQGIMPNNGRDWDRLYPVRGTLFQANSRFSFSGLQAEQRSILGWVSGILSQGILVELTTQPQVVGEVAPFSFSWFSRWPHQLSNHKSQHSWVNSPWYCLSLKTFSLTFLLSATVSLAWMALILIRLSIESASWLKVYLDLDWKSSLNQNSSVSSTFFPEASVFARTLAAPQARDIRTLFNSPSSKSVAVLISLNVSFAAWLKRSRTTAW